MVCVRRRLALPLILIVKTQPSFAVNNWNSVYHQAPNVLALKMTTALELAKSAAMESAKQKSWNANPALKTPAQMTMFAVTHLMMLIVSLFALLELNVLLNAP